MQYQFTQPWTYNPESNKRIKIQAWARGTSLWRDWLVYFLYMGRRWSAPDNQRLGPMLIPRFIHVKRKVLPAILICAQSGHLPEAELDCCGNSASFEVSRTIMKTLSMQVQFSLVKPNCVIKKYFYLYHMVYKELLWLLFTLQSGGVHKINFIQIFGGDGVK